MWQVANILPGERERHLANQYSLWVHRFTRVLKAEIEQLPEYVPPLPWPVQPPPIKQVRKYNPGLFPADPADPADPAVPKRRPPLKSYVPQTVDLGQARIEVYRPEEKDDFLWRIRFCWDRPRPWEIEALVDPGSRDYLRFFRQVTIRLPLKAKICCELKAGRDGVWKGACRRVKKLNVREPIADATTWLISHGQGPSVLSTCFSRPGVGQGSSSESAGRLKAGLKTRACSPERPAVLQSNPPLTPPNGRGIANSAGVAAYRAKVAEHERRAEAKWSPPRPAVEWPVQREIYGAGGRPIRYESFADTPWRNLGREQEREQLIETEREVLQGLFWSNSVTDNPRPGYLSRDDHDGYFLARREVGPDAFEYDRPKPHRRRSPWGRRIRRAPTARERLLKVKPSVRIVPTGPRSSELVVTRRYHEVEAGLKEALELARLIEAAIKRRDPRRPGRKRSWRQKFGDRLVNDRGGLLTWLVRNPIDSWDSGKWTNAWRNRKTLELGPAADPARFSLRSSSRPSSRPASLTTRFPRAALPRPYLKLVAHEWLTEDGSIFAATPGGDFGTSIVGFPLRLPLAAMPPADYERWQAREGWRPHGRPKPRRRRRERYREPSRRRRSPRTCTCFLTRPVLRTLAPWSTKKNPFFLRN